MLHLVGNRCRSRLSTVVLSDLRLALSLRPITLRRNTTKATRKRPGTVSTSKPRPHSPNTLTSTRLPGISPEEAVNPPASSRPPPLELPASDPTVPFYKYYFRLGRGYVGFYKAGFKQIIANAKIGRRLPRSPPQSIDEALREGTVTRGQYHLLLRTKSDISRIPLFALVFLICGEFTPLLVPFLSPIVPKTLWLPSQWEKARRKAALRRQRYICLEGGSVAPNARRASSTSSPVRPSGVEAALGVSNYNTGITLNAWPRWWDSWLVQRMPASYLIQRIDSKTSELLLDDFAICRDGGVSAMVDEEIMMALDARGYDIIGKEMTELRGVFEKELEKSKSKWTREMRLAVARG